MASSGIEGLKSPQSDMAMRKIAPFGPQKRPPAIPLGPGQTRLWKAALNASPESRAGLLEIMSLRLIGPLNEARLRDSLNKLVLAHEALRTRIVGRGGDFIQIIEPGTASLELQTHDLSELGPTEEDLAIQGVANGFLSSAHLEGGPAFRVCLMRLSQVSHVLICTAPNMLVDGWSISLLRQQLALFYGEIERCGTVNMPTGVPQLADYVLWKHNQKDAIRLAHLPYWQKHLEGVTPLRLVTDDRSGTRNLSGVSVSLALPETLVKQLLGLAGTLQTTPFVILFAAFRVALSAWSGEDDIVVGVIGGRGMAEMQNIVGFCANHAPCRVKVRSEESFADLVKRVEETFREARPHYYPHIEDIAEQLCMPQPFCNVHFRFNESVLPKLRSACPFGDSVSAVEYGLERARLPLYEDLQVSVVQHKQLLRLNLRFRPEEIDPHRIHRFATRFKSVLRSIVRDPGSSTVDLSGART